MGILYMAYNKYIGNPRFCGSHLQLFLQGADPAKRIKLAVSSYTSYKREPP